MPLRGQSTAQDPAAQKRDFLLRDIYSTIGSRGVPRGVGSVWAEIAWEAYWEVVNLRGFDPDLQNIAANAGNHRAMLYFNEGLKNTACGPPLLGWLLLAVWSTLWVAAPTSAAPPHPLTFSIVAADPEAGEVGVAVASRFFAVGTVVPHARAGVGAVATQSFANTTFGPRGLELLERGVTPEEALEVLLRADDGRDQRQVGIVAAVGTSTTWTGEGCNAWAGGRSGPGYAVQGNILTGEDVVAAMEKAYLESAGEPLAQRLYAALAAGDRAGGDSRGKQSAALVVHRERAGYGGYTDQAIDIRVDDHTAPLDELGRLLDLALVNDHWNRGWTAFTERRFPEALRWQEQTAELARGAVIEPQVLYDLAVIRLANGDRSGAREALDRAIAGNPKLAGQARDDPDLEGIRENDSS